MKSGFLRNLRTDSDMYLQNLWQLIPITILMYIFYEYMLGSTFNGGGPISILMFILTPLFVSLSRYTIHFKTRMGFSSTRMGFFLSGQINNLIYALFATLCVCAISSFKGYVALLSSSGIILVIVFTILLGIIGELYGIMIYRFGIWGFVFYMATFLTSTIVFIVYYIIKDGKNIFESAAEDGFMGLYNYFYNPNIILIMLCVCAVIAVLNWLLIRRMDIKN